MSKINKMQSQHIYHEYSNFVTNNKKYIQHSDFCICIQCKTKYKANLIDTFVYANTTAICKFCQSDLVIPNALYKPTTEEIEKWSEYINQTDDIKVVTKKRKL